MATGLMTDVLYPPALLEAIADLPPEQQEEIKRQFIEGSANVAGTGEADAMGQQLGGFMQGLNK